MTCAVDGCQRAHLARGLCGAHYAYQRRHGTPIAPPRPTLAERLTSRLVTTDNGCLEYAGCRNSEGYGRISLGGRGGRVVYTHRLAYEMAYGEFDDEWLVCHHCDNPPCCNPEHLFLGTKSTNLLDCIAKGLWNRHRKDWP